MKTYQDFKAAVEKGQMLDFISQAISEHRSSDAFRTALDADEYEAQRNVTISKWAKYLYTMTGQKVTDFTASNNKLANNFFHRLNTQRLAYSLGNGISFTNTEKTVVDGKETTIDTTKEALGKTFDTRMYKAGLFSLIHGLSFLFWNNDRIDVFKLTEFVPLWDEETGMLKAGIRFWSLDWNHKPVTVVLYEEDGYMKLRTKGDNTAMELEIIEPKRAYKQKISSSVAEGEVVVDEINYSKFPIVPLWGSQKHQSTLIGMRGKLDAFDLICSGFADDLQDCAEIYWILENDMGDGDVDLAKFRDKLKLNHIANIDGNNTKITPYTQEIPTAARTQFLTEIRNQIYEDFGALDVHTVAAGATNDHIDAAYQPMDEEADDFEMQIIEALTQILELMGIDDTPIFKRNRISNQSEQTNMVLMAADHLDEETILNKLPFITVDEVPDILARKMAENDTFGSGVEQFEEGTEGLEGAEA